MAVNSQRFIVINNTGDIVSGEVFNAAQNPTAPGVITIHNLTTGNNTITVPTSTGILVKGATIIPPAANLQALILKGVAGDTGITISKTDPTSIAFETAPVNFVLNAAAAIDGLRIIWS